MTSLPKTKTKVGFTRWLFELDRILRGEATRPSSIQQADINIPVLGVSVVVICLAMVYGFCMGIFALVHGAETSLYQRALMQTFASMCKVPLLFILTLVVTFPSLYVFNALVGSKLRISAVFRLLVASLAVNLAVLASMGPILAFFSVSTPSYPFIVLLNVFVFAIAGLLGLSFLVQTLNRLAIAERGKLSPTAQAPSRSESHLITEAELIDEGKSGSGAASTFVGDPKTDQAKFGPPKPAAPKSFAPQSPPKVTSPNQYPTRRPAQTKTGPLDQLQGVVIGLHVRKVFACWMVVFGLVGAQMGWVLRPFIGSPETPFQWFRARDSNFFEAVCNTIWNLFG